MMSSKFDIIGHEQLDWMTPRTQRNISSGLDHLTSPEGLLMSPEGEAHIGRFWAVEVCVGLVLWG